MDWGWGRGQEERCQGCLHNFALGISKMELSLTGELQQEQAWEEDRERQVMEETA